MIFFKIVCCFANYARGRFDNLRILGSGSPGMMAVLMAKFFIEKIKKPSEIF